ncbi:MAG TPA: efflux transporter outer membrane subunit [Burkholderiaceae bacterium]
MPLLIRSSLGQATAYAVLAGLSTMLLSACAAGPDYVLPTVPVNAAALSAYKEDGAWRTAQPAAVDAGAPWWSWYGDPQLTALVEQANQANQTLLRAEAQYRQAQAAVQGAAAAYYPTLSGNASGQRGQAKNSNGVSTLGDSHAWALQAAWEPDLWGRVSRSVEGAQDTAQATQADLAAAQLGIQATVVNNYIQLRLIDQQKTLYARTLEGYRKSLQLTQAQYRSGVAMRSDVALAQSTLATAEAQAIDIELTRRQLEHALAVLLGKTPAEFSLPSASLAVRLPTLPLGLPSELLQRRPDVAGAERRVASANAQIGVAEAAWFPHFTLSASGGFSGAGLTSWAATPDKVWALGFALAGTLFDGGLRSSQTAQARAAFDVAAANYRQTVLGGFQEVEDNLAALNELAQERAAQDRAVVAARDSERVLLSQYRAGTTTYLSVITAQNLALTAERTALQLQAREYAASVALVKAVGGGWNAAQPEGALPQIQATPVAKTE